MVVLSCSLNQRGAAIGDYSIKLNVECIPSTNRYIFCEQVELCSRGVFHGMHAEMVLFLSSESDGD